MHSVHGSIVNHLAEKSAVRPFWFRGNRPGLYSPQAGFTSKWARGIGEQQKTRLRIQATSTIESDGLAAVSGYGSDSRQSGPHGPQRLGSIQYLLFRDRTYRQPRFPGTMAAETNCSPIGC